MKKLYLLIFILSLSISSYGQRAGFIDELWRSFPKKPIKFRIPLNSPFLNDTTIVSTHAVYVRKEEDIDMKNYKIIDTTYSYMFFRFFENGEVFISFSYLSFPTEYEFNDLRYGKFGRYMIENGFIKIEYYTMINYGVEFMYAKPVPTGIQFFDSSNRNLGRRRLLRNSRNYYKNPPEGNYKKYYANLKVSNETYNTVPQKLRPLKHGR